MAVKTSWLVLGATALVLSKTVFWFFDDPEGPNLLIVTVLALVLYFPSMLVCSRCVGVESAKLTLAILTQVALAVGVYTLMG
ncbi:hypothetical protein KC727_00595 [Candidatus Kaiserbacteria bacterium]|nr:hypothetical protein [Candidatus Kaiserbacteria bacterium]